MKPLDPNRYARAELVDKTHRLPLPNGRFFGENVDEPGREQVDLFDPFIAMLFAGGSIKLVASAEVKPAAEAADLEDPHSTQETEAPLASAASLASS